MQEISEIRYVIFSWKVDSLYFELDHWTRVLSIPIIRLALALHYLFFFKKKKKGIYVPTTVYKSICFSRGWLL